MSYIELTSANFEKEVMESTLPVLIDFWAVWCGPCQMISPIISERADEHSEIKVCKVNVDEQPELAQTFGISSIPTLVLVKDKKIANVMVGFRSKEEILAMI